MHILAHTTIPLHKEAVWQPLQQVRKGKATVFWEVDFLKFVLALESKKKKYMWVQYCQFWIAENSDLFKFNYAIVLYLTIFCIK